MVGQMESLIEEGRGLRCLGNRIWVPRLGELRKKIIEEAHRSRCSIHPGTNKMYRDLRIIYWWPGMKDVAHFVRDV